MASKNAHSAALAIAIRQNDVVSYGQLDALGFTESAIRHALAVGRFHLVRPGVVAIGRPDVGIRGQLQAAILACPRGAISHGSAAILWEILDCEVDKIHVTVPADQHPRGADLAVHRRHPLPRVTKLHRLRVTRPLETLVDLAGSSPPDLVEAAVNEAD